MTAPEGREETYPGVEELESIVHKATTKNLDPYVEQVPTDMELLSKEPEGGAIVSERSLDNFKATEWKLSNGATVVYRYAAYQKNNVSLQAISNGRRIFIWG